VTALEKSTSFFNTSRKTYRHVYVFNDVKLNGRFRCIAATQPAAGAYRFAQVNGLTATLEQRLLKILPTAQPGTRGNVVLALPRACGGWGFGRDWFHPLPRTRP
jgi:hypothetical protein